MKNRDNKIHILFCSRLVLEKGVDILFDVIEKSLSDPLLSQKIIWHIASDGDFRGEIEKLVQKSNGSVLYSGKVSQFELAVLMRNADLLYMPSRFLETFGLTALEASASGIAVMGIKKGGLVEFIPSELSIDEDNPIESSINLLRLSINNDLAFAPVGVVTFDRNHWRDRFKDIILPDTTLFLLHDYMHRIGGAEAYIDSLCTYLPDIGYRVTRIGYPSITSPFKRRFMFIISLFAFWRGKRVYTMLLESKPDNIWMHSVLRYFGYWGVRAVKKYSEGKNIGVYLSHHDVGFITAFPQDIHHESEIPKSSGLGEFIHNISGIRKIVAIFKWIYIQSIRSVFPSNLKHIIFSPFLEKHIKNHFPGNTIHILPHTFDETIFHP